MTRNGNYVKMLKFAWKFCEITSGEYFWRVLAIWNHSATDDDDNIIYNNLTEDPDLFKSEGDYQFDIYR